MPAKSTGYGWDHQQARKSALEMFTDGTPCPLCGRPMRYYQALDLDHTMPIVFGGRDGNRRLVHARCNRSAGQRISALRAKARGNRGAQIAAIRRKSATTAGRKSRRVTKSDRRQW